MMARRRPDRPETDMPENGTATGTEPESGVLYVVATPIGNLEDITLRALKILGAVDWIAAEDTRRTRKLLARYGIATRLLSFSGDMEEKKAPALIEGLEAGESGAVVTDAGTPGASDPGGRLVGAALERGLRVVPAPGPSAIAAAFSVSGVAAAGFVFEGFPPRSGGKRKEALERIAGEERPVVFFESANRVRRTISELGRIAGDRRVIFFRELTKLNEEIVRTSFKEIDEKGLNLREKGEYTIIIEGRAKQPADAGDSAPDVEKTARALARLGAPPGNTAAALAEITGIPKNKAYKILQCIKEESE